MPTVTIRTSPVSNALAYAPQTAQNTMLLSRMPRHWSVINARPLVWHGPIPGSAAERVMLFTHGGISHSVKYKLCNEMGLPWQRRAVFPGGPDLHNVAKAAADEMDPTDPRYADLIRFWQGEEGGHFVTTNRAAWQAMGHKLYRICVDVHQQHAMALFAADMEDQREAQAGASGVYMSGVYEGVWQAMQELGHKGKLFTYGTASLARPVSYAANAQDGDIYMRLPGSDWQGEDGRLDVNHPNGRVFVETGAYVGGDHYIRRTMHNESLYQKNADGSYALDEAGNPIWSRGGFMISNYGQSCWLYASEPMHWCRMFYEQAEWLLAMWAHRCNTNTATYAGDFVDMPLPAGTHDLRPGLGNLKIGTTFRNNTEIETMHDPQTGQAEELWATPEKGIEASNARPQNPAATEFVVLLRSVWTHLLTVFANEGNIYTWQNGQIPLPYGDYRPTGGQDNVPLMSPMGEFETVFLARYRAHMFPDFHALMDSGLVEFILPKRFILAGNTAPGEREIDKPILVMFKERGGRRLWIFGCYPALDTYGIHATAQTRFWINGSGQQTGHWVIEWKGRSTHWSQMALPDGCQNVRCEDFRFETTTPLGQTFQASGNYNVSLPAYEPVPYAMPTGKAIDLVVGGQVPGEGTTPPVQSPPYSDI